MRSFQDEVEGAPDHFIRYHFPLLLDSSREAVGKVCILCPRLQPVFPNNKSKATQRPLLDGRVRLQRHNRRQRCTAQPNL